MGENRGDGAPDEGGPTDLGGQSRLERKLCQTHAGERILI